jgi:hypothetical protein
VHAIIRGEPAGASETAIPTSSRVSCGAPCGASVPLRAPPVPAVRHDAHTSRELLWRGVGAAGEDLTIFRGETREEAVQRLVRDGVVTAGASLEVGWSIRRGVIEELLSRRRGLLDALRPFVHRSQALGEGRAAAPVQPVLMARSPGREGGATTWRGQWDLRRNRVSAEPHPAGADSDGGAAEEAAGSAEEAAARYLWEHQHPASCSARKALVYMHDRAYWGFAANVHFMTVAFNYALAFNRTFLARESDHWNYGGRDCRHGWHCYFQNLSQCSERYARAHTHMHTHAHTCTHMHTYAHTCTHMHACTEHTHTHTRARTHTHTATSGSRTRGPCALTTGGTTADTYTASILRALASCTMGTWMAPGRRSSATRHIC